MPYLPIVRAVGGALIVLASLARMGAAQSRDWRALKPGMLLRVQTVDSLLVGRYLTVDEGSLVVRGPCVGVRRYICPEVTLTIPVQTMVMVHHQSDRVIQGALAGLGIGLATGAFIGWLGRDLEWAGGWMAFSVGVSGLTGLTIGTIQGSSSKYWAPMSLPPSARVHPGAVTPLSGPQPD